MSEILLVNPRRRRKHKSKHRRRHTARRRRTTSRRRRHTARRSSFRVRRVRARSNSVALSANGVFGNVKAGVIGAIGGILNDVAFGYGRSYLPAAVQTGFGASAVKLVTAAGVGWAGNKLLKGKGRDLAVGAATVVLHEALKAQLASMAPSIPLGELMFDNPGNPGLLGYNPGEIIADDGGEVGELMTGVGDYDEAF